MGALRRFEIRLQEHASWIHYLLSDIQTEKKWEKMKEWKDAMFT